VTATDLGGSSARGLPRRLEARDELGEKTRAEAGRPLRPPRVVALRAGGPRDVDVGPRDLADELLEEEGRRGGAGVLAADVLQIGDLGVELFTVAALEREPPHGFARAGRRGLRLRDEPVVVAEDARAQEPERALARAGERRDIDDGVGLRVELGGEDERV